MHMTLWILAGLACSNSTPDATPEALEGAAVEAAPAEATDAQWKHFGAAFEQSSSFDANLLLATPETYVDTTVRVQGRLSDVCQKAGCWMVLADDEGHSIRVTTDHAFFIDKDTIGDEADIEGKVERKEVDAGTVEHFKSEASGPDSIIPEEGKTHTYELIATTVALRP